MDIAILAVSILSLAVASSALGLLIKKELPKRRVRYLLDVADMGVVLAEQMSAHRKKEVQAPIDSLGKAKIASSFISEVAKISEAEARKLVEIRLAQLKRADLETRK